MGAWKTVTNSSTKCTGQTRFENSQAATHVSWQEQSTHTCDPPFWISKESPHIPNNLQAHISYTFALPQFPSFWKRQLMSPTYSFIISPIVSTQQFRGKNKEIKLASLGKRTGASAAEVLRLNHHATKGGWLTYFTVFDCHYQIQDCNYIHPLSRASPDTFYK